MIDLNKPFFNLKDAAEILQVAHSTLYEAVRTGQIQSISIGATTATARIPRSVLFPEAAASEERARSAEAQILIALDKREAADRAREAWLDLEREAGEALRKAIHPFTLNEIESARRKQASERRSAAV